MKSLLNHFDPITLEQMSDIRLMNRTDTKFVTTRSRLEQLLMLAKDDYYVQEIDGERIAPYYTLYLIPRIMRCIPLMNPDIPTARNSASAVM